MPQISATEFYALALRVHTFLADVPLHDVWAVDLPAHRDGLNLCEFLPILRSTDFRQRPARFSVCGFFLDAFFDLRPKRRTPWEPRLEVA
jgi:hypothetical protein